jgi:hypothetical protein
MLMPREKRTAGIIIEFKIADLQHADRAAHEALDQIKKMDYERELQAKGDLQH